MEAVMVICPQCGWPHDGIGLTTEEQCKFCGWKGRRADLLFVPDDKPQLADRLRELLRFMASNIAPQISVKVVSLGLVLPQMEYAPLLAAVMKNVTNAAMREIMKGLLEADNAKAG
jgi:hypothetical protein